MIKAGVIGLGQIGSGVALCLARSGHLGAVYDVRPEMSNDLEGVPPSVSSPAELARLVDVVLIAVFSAEQVIDVLSGPAGVLSIERKDLDIVVLSTISLEDLDRIRTLTDAAGVSLVDCGVTGGAVAARINGLVCLLGGDDTSCARVEPVLHGFSNLVVRMGGPGAGMAGKIIRNAIFIGTMRAGYEGVRLARAAGVDISKLNQVLLASPAAAGGPLSVLARPGDPNIDQEEAAYRENSLKLTRPRGLGLDSEAGGGGEGRLFRHLGAVRARKSL